MRVLHFYHGSWKEQTKLLFNFYRHTLVSFFFLRLWSHESHMTDGGDGKSEGTVALGSTAVLRSATPLHRLHAPLHYPIA